MLQVIQTRVDILARLINVASTETTRYYLNGVNVRTRRGTSGVVCEATNGHILAIEHDEGGALKDGESAIVSRETIAAIVREAKAVLKSMGRGVLANVGFEGIRVRVRAESFQLVMPDGTTHISCAPFPAKSFIDGAFPECERVIPRADQWKASPFQGPVDAYSAEYIATLARSSRTPSKRSQAGSALQSVIYTRELGSPAIMRVSGAPNWLGVIMPCRVDEASTAPFPSWFFGDVDLDAIGKPAKAPMLRAVAAE